MNIKLDGIGVLFVNSWRRLRERFVVAVEILIAPLVLMFIGRLLLGQRNGSGFVLGMVIECISILFLILSTLALVSAFGNETDFAGSYAASFKSFWPWVWAYILMELAIVGGLVMLIVPGIMLIVQLAFTNYVVVLEGKRGLSALTQGREYVKGYWWAFLGRSLLLLIGLIAAMLIFYAPATLLGGFTFGQFVYMILLLLIVPFSIAYQYEIYSNLRRLKPEVAEAKPKADSGFLKVSIVVGIVGLAMLFVLGVIGAIFLPTYFSKLWGNNQNPGGYDYTYNGSSIDPASGPVGTTVTIADDGFDATNTILMKGLLAARDVEPASDGSLSFVVPGSLAPNCNSGEACPQFLLKITPGDYDITVLNAEGTSSEGTFTVTENPNDGNSGLK